MAPNDWYSTDPDRRAFFTVYWAGGCRLCIPYASVIELFTNARGRFTIVIGGKHIEGQYVAESPQRDTSAIRATVAALVDEIPSHSAASVAADSIEGVEGPSDAGIAESTDHPQRKTAEPVTAVTGLTTAPEVPRSETPRVGKDRAAQPTDPAGPPADPKPSDPGTVQTLDSFQRAFADLLVRGIHHVQGVVNVRVRQLDKEGGMYDYPTR